MFVHSSIQWEDNRLIIDRIEKKQNLMHTKWKLVAICHMNIADKVLVQQRVVTPAAVAAVYEIYLKKKISG